MANEALTAQRSAVRAGHVGLGPGFIDKDEAVGLNASLIASPTGALASEVGPLLLGGAQGFFKRQPFGGQERPQRAIAHLDTALAQLAPQSTHRQIRCCRKPSQKPIPLR